MKRFYMLSLAILFASVSFAQTIVGTDPEPRKVILEEFTGIHCGFCPDGHRIAHELMEANPGNLFLIAIHAGSYANPGAGEPDFRTNYGEPIDDQAGIAGYPAGTVNRQNFPGLEQGSAGATAMSRGDWDNAADIVFAETSYVNVAFEATLDVETRELELTVELYYTDNSPENTNFLNVAIIQSNIEGPQAGMSANPNYVLPNGNYSHQKMFRDLVTGQWGEEITTTTTGSFVSKTYSYTVPENYYDIPAVIEHLELVVFVTETRQHIENGIGGLPFFTGFTVQNEPELVSVELPVAVCGNEIAPKVKVKSNGGEELTELDITYSINGIEHLYNWTGSITPLETKIIELPAVDFADLEVNTCDVVISNPNGVEDEDPTNNEGDGSFNAPVTTSLTVYLDLLTDNYGSETSWEVLNSAGEVLYSGSGYPDEVQTQINETFEFDIDCHSFVIYDAYGDGMDSGYGVGHYILTDSEGVEIMSGGNFGSSETTLMNVGIYVGINELTDAEVKVYPNPLSDAAKVSFNLRSNQSVSMNVYSVLGELVIRQQAREYGAGNNIIEINAGNLTSGMYYVELVIGANRVTHKISVSK
jgi:outer membrane protein Omp28/type IX secretion system substrate protein